MLIPLLMQLGMFGPKAGVRKFNPEYETDQERATRQKEMRAQKNEIQREVKPTSPVMASPTIRPGDIALAQEQLKALLEAQQLSVTLALIKEQFETLRPLLLELPRVTGNKSYLFPKKLAKQLDIEPNRTKAKRLKKIIKLLQEQEQEEEMVVFLLH